MTRRRIGSSAWRMRSIKSGLTGSRAKKGQQQYLVKAPEFLFRIFLNNFPTFHEAAVKRFSDLTEQEVLALAITSEDEDSRIYRGFAMGLRDNFPASAKVFDEMAEEE